MQSASISVSEYPYAARAAELAYKILESMPATKIISRTWSRIGFVISKDVGKVDSCGAFLARLTSIPPDVHLRQYNFCTFQITGKQYCYSTKELENPLFV